MDRLDVMRLFVRVAETASFSKAAKVEGLTQPTVSKLVASLEERLGVQLLRRTSRGLSLTEAGLDYHESCVRLLAEVETAEARIGRTRISPTGRIRVAVSPGFGRMHIVPRLGGFLAQYPDIAVDFEISDRYVNLIEDGIDVAIRIGRLADSGLVARRIGSVEMVTIAAPGYLAEFGEPKTPQDLERHACVTFLFHGAPRAWEFNTPAGPFAFMPDGRFRSNEAEHIRAAVLAGLGISHNASWLYSDVLGTTALRQILADYVPPPNPIHAITPARQMPHKVRVFVDFLADVFAGEPHLRLR